MVLVPGSLWLEWNLHILITFININIHLRIFIQISWVTVCFIYEITVVFFVAILNFNVLSIQRILSIIVSSLILKELILI